MKATESFRNVEIYQRTTSNAGTKSAQPCHQIYLHVILMNLLNVLCDGHSFLSLCSMYLLTHCKLFLTGSWLIVALCVSSSFELCFL